MKTNKKYMEKGCLQASNYLYIISCLNPSQFIIILHLKGQGYDVKASYFHRCLVMNASLAKKERRKKKKRKRSLCTPSNPIYTYSQILCEGVLDGWGITVHKLSVNKLDTQGGFACKRKTNKQL